MSVLRAEIEDAVLNAEQEISRQRLIRERATYRLEQAIRERERLFRHLAAIEREDSPSQDPEAA
jgi:hypothetical protein